MSEPIVELKETKRDEPGWDGKAILSVHPHGKDPNALCLQIRDKIEWHWPKGGRSDVLWLTRDQIEHLANELYGFLDRTANVLWTDGYGITRRANEMTSEHLKNVVRYLREQGQGEHPFMTPALYELKAREVSL